MKGRPRRAVSAAPLVSPEPLFTVLQIAGATQFSTAAVVKMITSGEMRGQKVGKEWRVSATAYDQWRKDSEVSP
jgi:excisionase family DNA binding protein